MTAKAAVVEAASPPKPTTAPAERLRQPSVDAGTGACADAGAGAGACAARPREDRDVLKEEEEKEEEEEDGEEEEEEAIRLAELLGEFRAIEEERQEAERMERGLHAVIVQTREDVYGPLLKRIALCEEAEAGAAMEKPESLEAGEGWRGRLEDILRHLRDKAAKALAVEQSALAALAEAKRKAVHWRRVQAAAGREIDELFLDAEEEKETAKALAEHEAQERKHALLELKHARDPAWARMPGGVGNLGWWKHVGEAFSGSRGDGGGGGEDGGGSGDVQSGGGAQSGGGGGGGDGAQSDGSGGGPRRGGGGDDAWMAARKGAGGGGSGRTGSGRTGSGDGDGAQSDGSGGGPQSRLSSVGSGGGPQSRGVSSGRGGGGETRCAAETQRAAAAAAAAAGKRRSPSKQRRADARASARLVAHLAQEELLAQSLLMEELGEEKARLLAQELAEQELALSSLVEEGVEWSVSEEEEEEEEIAEGWSPSEEEEEEDEEYEEESVDDEEREPEPEFAPGDTK